MLQHLTYYNTASNQTGLSQIPGTRIVFYTKKFREAPKYKWPAAVPRQSVRGLYHETQSLTGTWEQSPSVWRLPGWQRHPLRFPSREAQNVCKGVEDASVGQESEINTNLLSNKRNENKIKPARTGVSQLDWNPTLPSPGPGSLSCFLTSQRLSLLMCEAGWQSSDRVGWRTEKEFTQVAPEKKTSLFGHLEGATGQPAIK